MPSKIKQQGLNLIEIMVVLVIVGIIAGVGGPALTSTIERNNIRAETNRFIASLNFARSQAVTKQQLVRIGRTSGTSKDWSEGFIIFSDGNIASNDAFTATDGDILLREYTPGPSAITIKSNIADNYIRFEPSGRLANSETVIAFCNDDLTDGISGSQITISKTGRISTNTIAAANKSSNCAP